MTGAVHHVSVSERNADPLTTAIVPFLILFPYVGYVARALPAFFNGLADTLQGLLQTAIGNGERDTDVAFAVLAIGRAGRYENAGILKELCPSPTG